MRALVVGSGAREHALCLALARDPAVTGVHCAPGNAGTRAVAANHPIDPISPAAVAGLARSLRADLVVIGPEAALVAGVADACRASGAATFGPSAAAARIEGSKAFAKQVMAAAGVPTADSRSCQADGELSAALDEFGPPFVVKDDGLAAGKGVVVTTDRDVALAHGRRCLTSSGRVVVEEFLDGPELSLFAITDGQAVVALAPAQDFKRAGDGDTGPNTGGMGAYSPVPIAPPELVDDVVARVVRPTVAELAARGTPFVGLLYTGLALTSAGPRVVEFNARFGDPETQVVLARLRTPLGRLLHAAASGALAASPPLVWSPEAAVTVVVAAPGYPESPRTGDAIDGLAAAAAVDGVEVLHAGTRYADTGAVVSAGGRVLSITATGPTLAAARQRAYDAVARIRLPGARWRTDIALAAAAGASGSPVPR